MKKKKSVLESLTSQEIEKITTLAEKKTDVPLIKSTQVNMRLKNEYLSMAKTLAKLQGVPYTTFLTELLREDIDRLWAIYKVSKNKI